MGKQSTFKELWGSLSKEGKIELAAAISMKLKITAQAVYKWGDGSSKPFAFAIASMATEAVNSYMNTSYQVNELFPTK